MVSLAFRFIIHYSFLKVNNCTVWNRGNYFNCIIWAVVVQKTNLKPRHSEDQWFFMAKSCGHLVFSPICRSPSNCYYKEQITHLSQMSLYSVVLQFPLIATDKPVSHYNSPKHKVRSIGLSRSGRTCVSCTELWPQPIEHFWMNLKIFTSFFKFAN